MRDLIQDYILNATKQPIKRKALTEQLLSKFDISISTIKRRIKDLLEYEFIKTDKLKQGSLINSSNG